MSRNKRVFLPFFHRSGTSGPTTAFSPFLLLHSWVRKPQHSMLTFLSRKQQRPPYSLLFPFFVPTNRPQPTPICNRNQTEYSYFLNILSDFLCYNMFNSWEAFFSSFFSPLNWNARSFFSLIFSIECASIFQSNMQRERPQRFVAAVFLCFVSMLLTLTWHFLTSFFNFSWHLTRSSVLQ